MRQLVFNLTVLLSCLLLQACSIFDSTVPAKDNGFEISAEVVWNSDYMAYTIRLGLLKGESGEYTIDYCVDEDPLVRLRSAFGDLTTGSAIQLSDKTGLVLIIPMLSPSNTHSLQMHISHGDITRSYQIELPDSGQRQIGIAVDASTEHQFTRIIVSNLQRPSSTSYTLSFYLDSEPCQDIKYLGCSFEGIISVDFSEKDCYIFELPYILPGEHALRLDVRSSLGSQSSITTFIEPQRRFTELNFRYNDFTGELMLSSPYNPLGTAFDITIDMTVKGRVTYRHEQFFGIASEATEYFTQTAETSASLTPSLSENCIDAGKLKSLLDSIHGNARTDAANAIGNGNHRELHADITSIDLKFTIHSKGERAGKVSTKVSPSSSESFPIIYTYPNETWSRSAGQRQSIHPTYTINGRPPSVVQEL